MLPLPDTFIAGLAEDTDFVSMPQHGLPLERVFRFHVTGGPSQHALMRALMRLLGPAPDRYGDSNAVIQTLDLEAPLRKRCF